MYRLYIIKRTIEDIIISPFIFIGRMIARFRPMKREYRVFFFFPFYHTGGAEKVHAQIAAATGGGDCIIFFTRKSADRRFWNDFKNSGCEIRDISKFCDNKWLYFLNLFYRGIVTGYINRQKLRPVVFNGQCNFGYKISPWVKKSIDQIELIHSLNSFSYIRIPFLPFITKTVMISKRRIENHRELYRHFDIPDSFFKKICHIPNAIRLPEINIFPKSKTEFTVLYVGRSTPDKRVHLVAEIARTLHEMQGAVKFEIAGDVAPVIHSSQFPYIHFYGNINDEKQLNAFYEKAHVLILTSSAEGFPMVLMEAMARGCVILSTAVGDIPLYVKNGENGFLFSHTSDEESIVKEAVEKICWLQQNREAMEKMALNNISHARDNFGIERFNNDYRQLFSSLNPEV